MAKIGLFGAEHGNYVDIPFNVPPKLNKLEAWTDSTQGIISGIRYTYTDQTWSKRTVTIGAETGTHHVLFDTGAQGAGDSVVKLYGYADNDFVSRLGVKTNNSAGGSCGRETGRYFEIPVVDGSIVAFFGRSNGQALNAVGAYVVPHAPRVGA